MIDIAIARTTVGSICPGWRCCVCLLLTSSRDISHVQVTESLILAAVLLVRACQQRLVLQLKLCSNKLCPLSPAIYVLLLTIFCATMPDPTSFVRVHRVSLMFVPVIVYRCYKQSFAARRQSSGLKRFTNARAKRHNENESVKVEAFPPGYL